MTPQHPRTSKRNHAKGFMNLYLKARSQENLNSPQIKRKNEYQFSETKEEIKSATIMRRLPSKTDDFYKQKSPSLFRQEGVSKVNPFMTEKPSRFKPQEQTVEINSHDDEEILPQEGNFMNIRDFGIIESNSEEENRNGVQHENEVATQNDLNTDQNTITTERMRNNSTTSHSQLQDPFSIQVFRNYGISLMAYCLLLGLHLKLYSYHFVFAFLWTVQIYSLYCLTRKHSAGQKRANLIFGLIAIFAFEIFGFLRLEDVQVPLTMSLIPVTFSIVLSCYFDIYRSNGSSQFLSLLLKLMLWLQVLFICLKVDNFMDWTWQKVFCITWVLLAAASLYCLGLVGMFVFSLCFDQSTNYRDPQVVGLFWISFTFSGYIAVVSLLTFGFAQELQSGNDQPLILASLIAGICQIVFLTAFTIFQRVKIGLFINQIMGNDISSAEPKSYRIKLQKDSYNLPSHIVRFSSSYFLTLNQSLKFKDKEKLKNFHKRVLLIKNGKGNYYDEKSYNLPLIKENMSEIRDPSVSVTKKIAFRDHRKPKPLIIPSSYSRNKKLECFSASIKQPEISIPIDTQKLCFTADDIDYAKQVDYAGFLSNLQTPQLKNRASEKDDDKICIICCESQADAVIMGCGHGGVCYKCALESCQKSDKCFMCRKKVEKVLHIATNKIPNLNLIKVLSATKIVNEPQSATSQTN